VKTDHTVKALVLTALAPVFWSTGGLGIRLLDLSPWAILFWRALFMTLTLTVWSIYRMGGSFFTTFKSNILHGLPVSVFIGLSREPWPWYGPGGDPGATFDEIPLSQAWSVIARPGVVLGAGMKDAISAHSGSVRLLAYLPPARACWRRVSSV